MVSRVKGEETFLKGRKPKSLDHCWKVVLWEFNSYSHSCIKSSMEVLQKIQNKPLYDPAIPFLDMYLKELKSISRRDICTLMFIAALFTIAKVWKQAKCPTMEIKRKCNTYIYVHAVCVHTHIQWKIMQSWERRKPFFTVCNNMNRDKLDTERQVLYDLTYMWNLKKPSL